MDKVLGNIEFLMVRMGRLIMEETPRVGRFGIPVGNDGSVGIFDKE